MKKFGNLGKMLSKKEQKSIVGGLFDEGGACIHCTGYDGACGNWAQICYYRSNSGGGPNALCQPIYSGCGTAYGWWGACGGDCILHPILFTGLCMNLQAGIFRNMESPIKRTNPYYG
jgi:hypothetical protein